MKTKRGSGFTLVEMAVAFAVLVVVLTGAVTVVRVGQQTFRRSLSNSMVNSDTNRALNRIARRLTGAGLTTLFPTPVAPFGSDSLSFQEVVGFNAGTPLWSADASIQLEYETGETNNGMDDDGDGFVDECQVVRIENLGQPDEQRVVLVKGVREFLEGEEPDGTDENGNGLEDERGLCFELQGNELIVRLSVMRRDPEGGVTTRTLQTSISLRN